MSDMAIQPAQVQGAPSLPQVNLLPPHVTAKRRLAVVRVWLGLALLIVVLLTISAAVVTLWEKQSALSQLADVQATNDTLLHEQAKYAEAPKVLRALKARENARTIAMSTEVLWSPYLAAISAATPLEASVNTLTVTQDTAWVGNTSQVTGPLSPPGTVGLVSLNGRALTLTAVSNWQDALSKLKGVTNVEVASVQVTDDNGSIYFAVSATFSLTADAFANQFVTEK